MTNSFYMNNQAMKQQILSLLSNTKQQTSPILQQLHTELQIMLDSTTNLHLPE